MIKEQGPTTCLLLLLLRSTGFSVLLALNGVDIYGGAVNNQCTGIDVDSQLSEWTGFDCCSGHSQGIMMILYDYT